MPSRAPHPCPAPGCTERVRTPRCAKHTRAVEAQRGSRHYRGYGRHHEAWRRAILSRDPLCVRCLTMDRTTIATVADHVIPWKKGGEKYSMGNGRGLCATCHNQVRAEQGIGRAA